MMSTTTSLFIKITGTRLRQALSRPKVDMLKNRHSISELASNGRNVEYFPTKMEHLVHFFFS